MGATVCGLNVSPEVAAIPEKWKERIAYRSDLCMRLKLDLHSILNDSRRIEEALQGIIDEAIAKHATEVEIIPGKGSGALKKSVLRGPTGDQVALPPAGKGRRQLGPVVRSLPA
jgi:Smr domain